MTRFAVIGCCLIATPTALFFGLGDLLFGDGRSNAVFTVVFMVLGLGLLWAGHFAWES